MASPKVIVTFIPGSRSLEVTPGLTVLEAARLAGVNLPAPCGGSGRCGKCLVKMTPGPNQQTSRYVPACQTTITRSVQIELPADHLIILEQAQVPREELMPAVYWADGVLKHRAGLRLEGAADRGRLLGLAVDLGTTTMVGYLYDLTDGQRLATAAEVNGQLTYGADVLSRLAHALQGEAAYRQLRQALSNSLDQLILNCCRLAQVQSGDIKEIVIVGNTAMIHLLLNLPVHGLAVAPFQPAAGGPWYCNAGDLGLTAAAAAVCYLPPLIGGFVGSDALAAALAQGFGRRADEAVMLVDIGTNGEVLLQTGSLQLAASVPAGPAFEGGNIQCGMPAAKGAVCHVTMDYDVRLQVIGDTKPAGLCGSGLVDAVAEMLRLRLLDISGRLVDRHEVPPVVSFKIKQKLQPVGSNKRFFLADEVFLDQRDIRQVQLAKAAVAAGIKAVLAEAGLTPRQLDVIWLAGGFGNYLNPSNALRIGLLGEPDPGRICQVGNAAGAGACQMLLSYVARERATGLSQRFKHLELASQQRYQDFFMQELNFPAQEYGS
ncbi:ASKHA domain-containing protein [Desulfotomaculum varum]